MNIRWRLSVVAIQLGILLIATSLAIETPYTGATWFTAGLLSVVISSQILEPFYPRPADVIGNTLICLLLYATTARTIARPAWTAFLILIILLLVLSVFSSLFGTGKAKGKWTTFARVAKNISTEATAARIYSIVFWLSLIESYPRLEKPFWIMGVAWAILVILGLMDWQRLWETLAGKTKECSIEGSIAPSRVIVSAPDLPSPGSWVTLKTKGFTTNGVVISRIQRMEDVWGQIYLNNQENCESLLKSRVATYEIFNQTDRDVLGIADEGSTHEHLVFFPNRSLEIGSVVTVQNGEAEILYQVHSVKIQKLEVRGGALLQSQATAKQLGVFDINELKIQRYLWTPSPGTAVSVSDLKLKTRDIQIPESKLLVGYIKGTELPVYMDIDSASEGHLAILGMTQMGKTTLAIKVIKELAKKRLITILDQTGEYVRKRKLPAYTPATENNQNGISVLETKPEESISKAHEYLDGINKTARAEYEGSTPKPRTILIDEAHQYLPEPTGMDYKDPNREKVQKFGALMMQIRKYKISIILISQRTAVVAKSALSQCENFIAFRSFDKTGLEYLEIASGHELQTIVATLKKGEAVVFGPAFSCDTPVAIQVVQDSENQQEEVLLLNENVPSEFDNILPEDDIPF